MSVPAGRFVPAFRSMLGSLLGRFTPPENAGLNEDGAFVEEFCILNPDLADAATRRLLGAAEPRLSDIAMHAELSQINNPTTRHDFGRQKMPEHN